MEEKTINIQPSEVFEAAELLELYGRRLSYLESILEAAKSRGDIDELSKVKAEIQQVTDAINATK